MSEARALEIALAVLDEHPVLVVRWSGAAVNYPQSGVKRWL